MFSEKAIENWQNLHRWTVCINRQISGEDFINFVAFLENINFNKISFPLQVLDDYSEELQKKFLLFTTGSDRVPVGGMGEMTFKITKMVTKTPKNKVIY